MQDIINNLKKKWVQIFKFGVLSSGVIIVIVSPPPITDFNVNTIRFLITIIIAFLLIPILLYSKIRYFKKWMAASIASFFVSTLLIVTYNIVLAKYVVNYEHTKVIVGRKIKDSALKNIKLLDKEENKVLEDGSRENNEELLATMGGHVEYIWDPDSINNIRILIVSLFYFSISFITILVICVIQTLQTLLSRE
jgi:hypothetical protein